ncbi:MAG: DUF4405 domain-containing protein [Anaerolineales bacterium]|nr:DUF4405 domain-containing protein [Anaerolineales bacterium]
MFGKAKSNLWLDAAIFLAFLVTALTGLLFWLVLPEGPGSSAALFLGVSKSDWADIHNWAGVAMLTGASVHILLHWKWAVCVARRYFQRLARQARLYFSLDSLLLVAFVLANLSGLVAWLILPQGGYQGGRNPAYNALLLGLTRHEWNDLHLWSSLAIIAILGVHVWLHWKWIVCMARRYAFELQTRDIISSTLLNRLHRERPVR